MPIDKAELERKAEDAKYRFDQIRQDPEKVRKYIGASILLVVCLVTALIWIARITPDAESDEAAQAREALTSESWIEKTMRKLQRDERFRQVSVTESATTIMVQGRVATVADLRELREMIVQSSPPAAMQWSVTTDEP